MVPPDDLFCACAEVLMVSLNTGLINQSNKIFFACVNELKDIV